MKFIRNINFAGFLLAFVLFFSSLPLAAEQPLDTDGGQTFTSFGGSMEDLAETARLYDAGIWHHREEIVAWLLPEIRNLKQESGPILMYRDQFIILEDEEQKENNESVGGFHEAPEDWFMHDRSGNRIPVPDYHEDYYGEPGQRRWFMDPGHPGFQQYWIKKTIEHLKEGHWDGLFVDDVLLSVRAHRLRGGEFALYPDDEALQQAVLDFLSKITQAVRETFGEGENRKRVIPNISESYHYEPEVLNRFLEASDGYMEEHLVTAWQWDESVAAKQMEALRRAALQGKHIFLLTYDDPSSDIPNLMETSLAAYLVALGGYENAYWSYRPYDYAPFNERPAFEFWENLNLGEPQPAIEFLGNQGASVTQDQAVVWLRRFERGLAVVNVSAFSQQILFEGIEISLRPFEGKVLSQDRTSAQNQV